MGLARGIKHPLEWSRLPANPVLAPKGEGLPLGKCPAFPRALDVSFLESLSRPSDCHRLLSGVSDISLPLLPRPK